MMGIIFGSDINDNARIVMAILDGLLLLFP
jgi:hypothetical protein